MDCTLAKRLYCADNEQNCVGVTVNTTDLAPLLRDVMVVPNPNAGRSILQFELPEAASVELQVVNALGQVRSVRTASRLSAGPYQWDLQLEQAGMYTCLLKVIDEGKVEIFPVKMLVK